MNREQLIEWARAASLDTIFWMDDLEHFAKLATAAAQADLEVMRHNCDATERELAAAQARIDELMLEHCPDEMTPEQVAKWAKHQRRDEVLK